MAENADSIFIQLSNFKMETNNISCNNKIGFFIITFTPVLQVPASLSNDNHLHPRWIAHKYQNNSSIRKVKKIHPSYLEGEKCSTPRSSSQRKI